MIHHISDYITSSKQDATSAINTAIFSMADGDTLALDGMTFFCSPKEGYQAFYAISNNEAGDKTIAFPLIGRKNITIDGMGARFTFQGRILPFVIDRSENITVKNLTIDYSSPYYVQPRIVEADENRVLLYFDSPECGCRVRSGNFCIYSRADGWEQECMEMLTMEFSSSLVEGEGLYHKTNAPAVPSASKPPYIPYCAPKKDHGFASGMYRDVVLREIAPDMIEMCGQFGFVHTVGAYLVMTFAGREFPGVLITEAKNVTLENIHLAYTSGMGVVAQLSENITLNGVKAYVEEDSGRVLSVNADATHFINCRGKIELYNCKFTNMMDDACNIHGIYGIVCRAESPNILRVGFGHGAQEGMCYIKPGDQVAVIDSRHTKVLHTLTAAGTELISMKELWVEVAEPLPAEFMELDFESGDILIENLSTAPEVVIRNCESGYNRPRGFLISTAGKVLIEDCSFYNMYYAVQIGGEMRDWYESGAVKDVTIRNCRFDNSAYAGGEAIRIVPWLWELPETPFHGKINIVDNHFEQSSPRLLSAVSVGELIFKGNVFEKNDLLPVHGTHGENGITVEQCGKVKMQTVIS